MAGGDAASVPARFAVAPASTRAKPETERNSEAEKILYEERHLPVLYTVKKSRMT